MNAKIDIKALVRNVFHTAEQHTFNTESYKPWIDAVHANVQQLMQMIDDSPSVDDAMLGEFAAAIDEAKAAHRLGWLLGNLY